MMYVVNVMVCVFMKSCALAMLTSYSVYDENCMDGMYEFTIMFIFHTLVLLMSWYSWMVMLMMLDFAGCAHEMRDDWP